MPPAKAFRVPYVARSPMNLLAQTGTVYAAVSLFVEQPWTESSSVALPWQRRWRAWSHNIRHLDACFHCRSGRDICRPCQAQPRWKWGWLQPVKCAPFSNLLYNKRNGRLVSRSKMPLLHMPTGHPHYEGTTVDIRIRIQGEAEPTREYPCSNNGDRSRVESRPGLRYEVLLTVSNPNKKDASTTEFLEAEIEIDGRSARSVFLPHNGTYSVDTKASGDHRFPLVFDTPTVVAEGGLKDSAEAEWLGTIRVNIWLTQKGGMGEVPVRNPTKLCINELTKKAALTSATTSYGQPKKGRARAIIRIRVDPTPLLSHTFNYKTRDFLEIEGVLPPLPANQRTLHMPVPGQSVDVEEEKPMKRDEPCSSTCGVVSEHEEFELLRVKRQKRPLPSLPADSCFVDLTRLDSNALHSKFTVKMENGAEVYCLDEDDRDGKSRIKMERVIDLTWN